MIGVSIALATLGTLITAALTALVAAWLLDLAALPALLLYPCLAFHLFEPDESRYAQVPLEMLARGDLVVPTLQGEPYLDKPPLFYWLVMASYRVFGVHDWAARLVPALAVHVLVSPDADCHSARRRLQRVLEERFHLHHVTLQVDHVAQREQPVKLRRR